MRIRGRLKQIESAVRGAVITLAVTAPPQYIEQFNDADLDITMQVHRNARSLSANAYFHVLVNKIADARTLRGDPISKTREKNELIAFYGQDLFDKDGEPVELKIIAPVRKVWEYEGFHGLPYCITEEEGVGEWAIWKMKRPSHTYNSKEMAVLIDGAINDAREWGVKDIETPDELARLKAVWEQA